MATAGGNGVVRFVKSEDEEYREASGSGDKGKLAGFAKKPPDKSGGFSIPIVSVGRA